MGVVTSRAMSKLLGVCQNCGTAMSASEIESEQNNCTDDSNVEKQQAIQEKNSDLVAKEKVIESHLQTSLHWERCANMPEKPSLPRSILIGDAVFVVESGSLTVLRCDTKSDAWSVLPAPCPVRYFGLGQLSGKLLAVGGGMEGGTPLSDVYTYEQETQQWEKSIPPMPTPRSMPNVITYKSSIAVCGAGGIIGGDRVVEVFNSETAQWYTAAPLPVACVFTQLTIINDTCYLGGGGLYYGATRSIMCASLPSLFPSSSQTASESQQQSVWTMLPDTPLYGSALANTGDTLLALGGYESIPSSSSSSDAIYAYDPSNKAWLKVASLPQACISATAELLPSGSLMLIGGYGNKDKFTKSVYVGTFDREQK